MTAIYATAEGTARYRDRFTDLPGHFRQAHGLWLSSIGLGTYLGNATDAIDKAYAQAIVRSLELGCNVIDTAINYRHQRSERAIGKALKRMFKAGVIQRDEIIIATKGGYLPFDRVLPADRDRYLHETFVDTGLAAAADIVNGQCLAPRFLRAMIEQSRRNLGVDCIDLLQLHTWTRAWNKTPRPLDTLKELQAEGKIRYIGISTPEQDQNCVIDLMRRGYLDAVLFELQVQRLLRILPDLATVRTHPRDAVTLARIGHKYIEMSVFGLGRAYLQRAVEADPDDAAEGSDDPALEPTPGA